MKSGTS